MQPVDPNPIGYVPTQPVAPMGVPMQQPMQQSMPGQMQQPMYGQIQQPMPTLAQQPMATQVQETMNAPVQPTMFVPMQQSMPVPMQQSMPIPMVPQYVPTVAPTATSYSDHLNVLNQFGGLYIKQKIETLEAITGFETENKYKVYLTGPDCLRSNDQKAYFSAEEESDCMARQFCGNMRAFTMRIMSPDNQVVLQLKRPFKCTCCCCNLPEMHIEDGGGNKIGTVKNRFNCCADEFDILDHNDEPVLKIHGDCCQWGKFCTCPCGPCTEVHYDIINPATNSSGYIKKVWSGGVEEIFTDADSFCLSFPPDATIYHKILLLGAVFLIDFMYFENNNDNN